MITPKEYAGLLTSINKKIAKMKNISIHHIHSTYYPKAKKISQISMRINYTEDGSPLSNEINKVGVPINAKQKQIRFRLNECNKTYILFWLDTFIILKRGKNNGN
jgi:hypothetical protein